MASCTLPQPCLDAYCIFLVLNDPGLTPGCANQHIFGDTFLNTPGYGTQFWNNVTSGALTNAGLDYNAALACCQPDAKCKWHVYESHDSIANLEASTPM